MNHFTMKDLHDFVDAMSTALDAKNSYTKGHSDRVAELSSLLAKGRGLPLTEQGRIHIGAHLHDIGKIGIPDVILDKQGKLTDSEFAVIRRHPEIGDKIVGKIGILQSVTDIVRHHHERFDGNGYPDRLKEDKFSLGARIVSVADAFDAMTSIRAYRAALSIDEAIEEMRRCSGSQFDPQVVDVLIGFGCKRQLGNYSRGAHSVFKAFCPRN